MISRPNQSILEEIRNEVAFRYIAIVLQRQRILQEMLQAWLIRI